MAFGRLQMEGGLLRRWTRNGTTNGSDELLLRVGVHRKVELRFELPGWARQRESGISNEGFGGFGVGAKWNIADSDEGTAKVGLGVVAGVEGPTLTRDQGDSDLAAFIQWNASYAISEATELGIALGYDAEWRSGHATGSASGGISIEHELSNRWKASSEWFHWQRESEAGTRNVLDAALIYRLGKDSQLDINAGFDPARPSATGFIGLGWTVRFDG